MLFLLANWKSLLSALGGSLLTALAAYFIHSILISRLEVEHAAELAAQATSYIKACDQDKQTTEETSREYQTNIANLRSQLDAAKRVRPHACVSVTKPANPAAGRDAKTPNTQLSNADASVDSDSLYDFAFDAEQVGQQLDSCQEFIRKERSVKTAQ